MIERALWITGTLLLSIFFGHLALAEYHRVNEIAAFRAQAVSAEDLVAAATSAWQLKTHTADQSLWSAGRVASFAASLEQETVDVLALFSIPRLGLEVPLYDGASALHLNRGVARIDGTAMPGAPGNIGIAGHRDGFFRVLNDIRFGDELTVTTVNGEHTYRVQQLMIVEPDEINVLDHTEENAITLVTCYPFHFVGHAPQRFIVRAVQHP